MSPSDGDRSRIMEHKSSETDWKSIHVATALSFVGAVQFSLYFSSLFPYMRITDPGMSEGFFGVIVAVYSLGQVISAPAFGEWSNRIRKVTPPLSAGLTLMLIGNVVYILMEPISIPKRFILLLCRFIVGMGSGNVALLRTYASTASSEADRSRAIAFVTCGQAVGQVAGPMFQFIFTPFKYPGVSLFGLLHFNLYTMPAYLACVINIVALYALYHHFDEKYVDLVEENTGEQDGEAQQKRLVIPMYDVAAVLICYATRFCDMFARSTLETLGSPFAMMMFAWDEATAVRWVALAQGTVGALTLAVYLLYIFGSMEKFIHCRIGTMASLGLMILFHVITYAWPFLPHHVHKFTTNIAGQNTSALAALGCNATKFDWCHHLTRVNVYVYFLSYVILIGLAFPLLTITLTTLFSQILGPRRQGTQQGIFQASSAAARMIGPLIVTQTYLWTGPRPVWILEIGVIGAVLASWSMFYTRMVPLRMPSVEPEPANSSFGYENPQFLHDDHEDIEELR